MPTAVADACRKGRKIADFDRDSANQEADFAGRLRTRGQPFVNGVLFCVGHGWILLVVGFVVLRILKLIRPIPSRMDQSYRDLIQARVIFFVESCVLSKHQKRERR